MIRPFVGRHQTLKGNRVACNAAGPKRVSSLRKLLQEPGIIAGPCCHDALSAKLIEEAGFKFAFMSGFCVSATKLGAPDAGLISYNEMVEQGRYIVESTNYLPIIGDGDTGYGNAMNVKRTLRGYQQQGLAGIILEDQVWPKQCGHINNMEVVSRQEARMKIRAAVAAREESGEDMVIVGRTDAKQGVSFTEALLRVGEYGDEGADVLFIDALESREEMEQFLKVHPEIPKMANMLEGGKTPIVSQQELEDMGFKLVSYPLSLLGVSIKAMQSALALLSSGTIPSDELPSFQELKDTIGFKKYFKEADKYTVVMPSPTTPPLPEQQPQAKQGSTQSQSEASAPSKVVEADSTADSSPSKTITIPVTMKSNTKTEPAATQKKAADAVATAAAATTAAATAAAATAATTAAGATESFQNESAADSVPPQDAANKNQGGGSSFSDAGEGFQDGKQQEAGKDFEDVMGSLSSLANDLGSLFGDTLNNIGAVTEAASDATAATGQQMDKGTIDITQMQQGQEQQQGQGQQQQQQGQGQQQQWQGGASSSSSSQSQSQSQSSSSSSSQSMSSASSDGSNVSVQSTTVDGNTVTVTTANGETFVTSSDGQSVKFPSQDDPQSSGSAASSAQAQVVSTGGDEDSGIVLSNVAVMTREDEAESSGQAVEPEVLGFRTSTILRLKISDKNTKEVELETRIPAGWLDGMASAIPQIAGVDLDGLLSMIKGEKWDPSEPILDEETATKRIQIFVEKP